MVSVPPSHPPMPTLTTPTTTLKYQFSHPTTFLPVPYYTDTSLSYLYEQIIPSTRTMRSIMINVPVFNSDGEDRDTGGMDVDAANAGPGSPRTQQTFSFSFAHQSASAAASHPPPLPPPPPSKSTTMRFTAATAVASVQVDTYIQPDGLLLYVAESSYEPGTSPLSSWIPIVGYEQDEGGKTKNNKNGVKREKEKGTTTDVGGHLNGC